MTKVIEKYIQFAIDNGYKTETGEYEFNLFKYDGKYHSKVVVFENETGSTYNINLYQLITSKPFIEVVARGTRKIQEDHEDWIDWITKRQAIAIRDDKLEEFINNLLPND